VGIEEDTNRKATIVIEHLIQASDIFPHYAALARVPEMECETFQGVLPF
jgi:hypothetical protein